MGAHRRQVGPHYRWSATVGPAVLPGTRLRARQDEVPPSEIVQMLAEAGERGLVIAGGEGGSGAGAIIADAVAELSAATGWPVMASPLSVCRLAGAIGAADALLRSPVVQGWQPEIVVRLGAPWASRVVNEWLAALACTQVLVDPWGVWAAPDHAPGEVVVTSPAALVPSSRQGGPREGRGAEGLEQRLVPPMVIGGIGCPGRDIRCARTRGRSHGAGYRADRGRCGAGRRDFGGLVVDAYPGCGVVGPPARRVAVVANRGVNGIDGVLSTALGFATSGQRRARHGVAR